ncbi:MAG: chromosomal replication initiator protein DnaA [Ruminococcaceae bacterium]|nr:chromosomal replication initiator protein DnaA [Oscillospiraceae bacterium]
MQSTAYIWAKVLSYLEQQLSSTVVATWFDDTEIVELTDSSMTVFSPVELRRDTISRRWIPNIQDAMQVLFDMNVSVKLVGEEQLKSVREAGSHPDFIKNNPQFTFQSFVVGASNRFAHGAALAVANKPADAYNPLFIYGQSGLGKTHLLYAIAAEIHRQHPEFNIVYIKGDQFTNELIEALRVGDNFKFRSKYRNADLFLVDDIHFIAGKESTQEEFFNTFNALYENHKQIVLTSDQPPSGMLKLEDRLKTRFEWGLTADIQPPDYETRMAIIKNKAITLGVEMPDDVCSYIAENITTNIRQIEGTVKKIMAYRDLAHIELDVASVSRAIKDMYKDNASSLPTPSLIISEVSRYFSIEEHILRGTLRNKGTAEARQIAMYLIRNLTQCSLPDIGKEFGRDHATVIHSIRKVETMLKDPTAPMKNTIRDITANINNRL